MSQVKRFQVSARTLLFDRLMTHLIKVGGAGIITAVLAIFLFILWQIIPLFQGAKVTALKTIELTPAHYRILGLDEWAELPFVVDEKNRLSLIDLAGARGIQAQAWPWADEREIAALAYDHVSQKFAVVTPQGKFALVTLQYQPVFEGGQRTIEASLVPSDFYDLLPQSEVVAVDPSETAVVPQPEQQYHIKQLSFGSSEERVLLAALLSEAGKQQLRVVTLEESGGLMDEGELSPGNHFDLTSQLSGPLKFLRVNESADTVLVGLEDGTLQYFYYDGDELVLRQSFKPFAGLATPEIHSVDYILGGVSFYVTHASGVNRVYSLLIPAGKAERVFVETKQFADLASPSTFFESSLRNKAFLVGGGDRVSLRYTTSTDERWQSKLSFEVQLGGLSRKYHRIALLDKANKLHLYELDDPHPEGGWKTFFSKLWYEGFREPSYTWQSTGGTDAFEPKLSLIPLLIGTLKGTFYAMIFALPIALLAGLYASQFLEPRYKTWIKPMMEIMASLPSVILGFLAALWLAPIIEDRVPSLLLIIVGIPLAAIVLGYAWHNLPRKLRQLLPVGTEVFFLVPFILVLGWVLWQLGPWLEQILFAGSFREWWPEATGTRYEQRNCLVVGFIMGFAVIPIIFTITEDALSSVPMSIRSAALALGASRWQTAWRVVMPTAAAGIFSAVMIGLGRAVGETMIVLMATGNTPIMEWNIFSGMRTLSANLAVELPEAPYLGTLYRTLYLGAMVLFLLTFIINTFAELLRQHLREKYRTL